MITEFYRPGESILHKWDARMKLLCMPLVVAAFFIPSSVVGLLALTAFVAAVVALTLGASESLQPAKSVWPILALIAVLTPPFHRGGAPVVTVAGFTVLSAEGIRLAAVLLLRFLGSVYAFFALVRTLALDDMVLALRWFGLPYSGCLVVTITLRMIPTVADTWHATRDAHRMRAGTDEARRIPLAGYLPALTSVMIQGVKTIPLLAMALEARGFGRSNPRTALAGLKGGSALLADAGALVVVAAILLVPSVVRL